MDIIVSKKHERMAIETAQFERRIIWIRGDINDEALQTLTDKLSILQRRSRTKAIHLYIASPGGDCDAGFGMYDAILGAVPVIKTTAIGEACSAAIYPLIAGDIGHRRATKNAILLLHPARWNTGHSTTNELADRSAHLQALEKRSIQMLLDRTKMDRETIVALSERESYMYPVKARKLGIIDKVITRL